MRRVQIQEAWELLIRTDPPAGVVLEPGQEWLDAGGGAGVVYENGREVRRLSAAEVRALALGGAK